MSQCLCAFAANLFLAKNYGFASDSIFSESSVERVASFDIHALSRRFSARDLNRGQLYEKKIQNILKKRNLLPSELHGNDAGFIHKDVVYYVEVKNNTAPDYGQKKLTWSRTGGWQWSEKDIVTDLYDKLGVINRIDKTFVPKRYTVPADKITEKDREYDMQMFEKRGIELQGTGYLYDFYARKKCYYIQIENKGFYHLKQDIANLIVPRFEPKLTLRLRAKTHHSFPYHNYSFFAVIQARTTGMLASEYDLEEKVGKFPAIIMAT